MNKILIFTVFIAGWLCGCQAVSSQTQIQSKQEKTVSKPMPHTSSSWKQVDPGTVRLKGTLHKIWRDASIVCGRSLLNVADVQVDQVLAEGAGVANPVSAGDTIKIQFQYGFKPQKIEGSNLSLPGIKPGDSFVAQLREKPCFNGTGSYFEMTVYNISE